MTTNPPLTDGETSAEAPENAPVDDRSSLPISERVEILLAQMTLEEKGRALLPHDDPHGR